MIDNWNGVWAGELIRSGPAGWEQLDPTVQVYGLSCRTGWPPMLFCFSIPLLWIGLFLGPSQWSVLIKLVLVNMYHNSIFHISHIHCISVVCHPLSMPEEDRDMLHWISNQEWLCWCAWLSKGSIISWTSNPACLINFNGSLSCTHMYTDKCTNTHYVVLLFTNVPVELTLAVVKHRLQDDIGLEVRLVWALIM